LLSFFPKTGQPENKVEKFGMFLATEKHHTKTPQLPRISPQLHHVFTTTKHPKIAKTPAKTSYLPK
jgi:hypothetical protein